MPQNLMMQELGNAFAFIALAAALPPLILFISKFFRPSFPYSGKLESYECGELPVGSAYVMFNNRFYLVAIIFLVFDVEVAMMFPLLKLFRGAVETDGPLAWKIFALAMLFVGILLLGLIYALKKGDIDWVKDGVERAEAFKETEFFQQRINNTPSVGTKG
ncbi:MAG: NADH-quinone oxidoreductase subunit A [Bdellovibrionota bacterium]